jgi:hypothetical protein
LNISFLYQEELSILLFHLHGVFPPAVVLLKNTTALKMAGKKYHGEGKIGENHNIWGKKA